MRLQTLKMAMNKEVARRVVHPVNSSSNISRRERGTGINRTTSRCRGVNSSIIYSMVIRRS